MKRNQFVLTAIRLSVSAFLFFCGALLGSNDGQIIAPTEKMESTVVCALYPEVDNNLIEAKEMFVSKPANNVDLYTCTPMSYMMNATNLGRRRSLECQVSTTNTTKRQVINAIKGAHTPRSDQLEINTS